MSNQENYIINFDKVLGTGATAEVYLGIRASDGYLCALKCSKMVKRGFKAVLTHEISIMKDLNHENIIKFYESISNFKAKSEKVYDRVIVMEYCNKGSLYDFAELHRGLCDNMFLRVLECLNKGIYYLRGKSLLHRDIKPGNMMVHQDDMGYFHVKLGDMGTTKRVDDSETFKTLVGTQEYLHPDMLIQFLGGIDNNFTICVDLWSTGVTLYHAAASQLPFIPFKYSRVSQKSKESLKDMYINKKPGIISAIQNSADSNDISWSDKLPIHCRLSPMLNDLASKLIGDLMDLSSANTYERFFEQSNQLSNKKRILVFNSYNGELLILYLDTLTYDTVVDKIAESTGFPKKDLILLTRNKILEPLLDSEADCLRSMPVKGHMRYALTDDTVLVVIRKLPLKTQTLASKKLTNSNSVSSPRDNLPYDQVKKHFGNLMKSIYEVGYTTNYIDCQLECYLATMFSFNQYVLVDDLRLMHESLPWQMLASRGSCTMTHALISIAEDVIKNIRSYATIYGGITKCKDEITRLETKTSESETSVNAYYTSIVEEREMFKYTKKTFYSISDAISNDNLDFLVHSAEELVNEMMVIPEKKLYQEDSDIYKLEIWQRHIRLFKYYEVAIKRFTAKSQRITDVHKYFYTPLTQGLELMKNIANWKITLGTVEENRSSISKSFMEMIDWWKNLSSIPTETDVLRKRIIEIQDLLGQLTKLDT